MKKSDIYLLIITLLFPAPFISGCSGSSGGGESGSTGSPVAAFTAVPSAAGCSINIEFDASSSFHENPDFSIVKYEWDFDYNGSVFTVQDNGKIVSHAFSSPCDKGTHTVALRVTGSSSEAGKDITTDTVEVSFTNHQPVSDAGGPYTVYKDGGTGLCSVILDGSASYDADAPCDEVSLYQWDTDGDGYFGADDTDGTYWSSGTDLTGVYPEINTSEWNAGQTITLELIVTDCYGLESAAASSLITVYSAP